MKDMQNNNEIDLDQLIYDLEDMGLRILSMDRLIKKVNNPDLMARYADEILQMVEYWKVFADYVAEEIEKYVEKEKKENLPINFQYRSVLKSIKAGKALRNQI